MRCVWSALRFGGVHDIHQYMGSHRISLLSPSSFTFLTYKNTSALCNLDSDLFYAWFEYYYIGVSRYSQRRSADRNISLYPLLPKHPNIGHQTILSGKGGNPLNLTSSRLSEGQDFWSFDIFAAFLLFRKIAHWARSCFCDYLYDSMYSHRCRHT